MQLPAQLQELLLQAAHVDPQPPRHLEQCEIVQALRPLEQLAAGRTEMRAQGALVAVPADQWRMRRCRNRAHNFFRNSWSRHKKSGWRVRLPTTFQTRLCDPRWSKAGLLQLRRKRAAAAAIPRRVGVLKDKSLAHQRLFVLQRRAIQV